MNRYNMFYQVHKGLREMLYQTATRLQQTDFTNAAESTAIASQMTDILELFDAHAHTEDNFVLTALEAHEPSVASLFEEEHVQDHTLSKHLKSLLTMLQHSIANAERNEIGSAIRVAFVDFLVFNLKHMAKEEKVLNNLLWQYYSDEELHGITQKILAHLQPDTSLQYSTWMMRALSNSEIIAWLKEIKNNAPDFVFDGMLRVAEKELSGSRWSAVQEEITEGAMLA
ncbi:hypothetical protein BH11BAC3_BH11BAC3_11860 [soil metagenome]